MRRVEEGVSELVIQGPTPAVHAGYDTVDALARLRRADGDPRPLGVLRADTATDLLLRPWDTSRPPVTAHLVVHASARALRPDGDPAQTQTPGELDGVVVSAAECRDVLREVDVLDLHDPPAGGSILVAVDDPATGQTIAAATRRARTDLDHGDPYECGGPTACQNLCCLCRRHHRIKTFAKGWSFQLQPDGRLSVRTPAGITRTTDPPGCFPDPEPDPPWLEDTAPPDPLRQ